ncbi:hypothetical protein CFI10_04225 [Marinobacterium iners]|nr:hypothetical protein CFI10_04225 [Marinobacterium iners]
MTLDNHNNLIIHFSEPVTSCLRYRNWNSGLQVECWSDGQWESKSDDYGIPLLQLAHSEPDGRFRLNQSSGGLEAYGVHAALKGKAGQLHGCMLDKS